jgi:Ca2+-binding RTX toxin-like protein
MTRWKKLVVAVASATLMAVLTLPATASAVTGQLTQLGGAFGCVSDSGTGGQCANGNALLGPMSVTVSPDGRSAYGTSIDSDAVTVFARNPTTGALTQLAGTAGCVSETGNGGQCADGKALDGAFTVTVSSDGKSVYVASLESGAVAAFARDTASGALSQLGGTAACISETGSGGECVDGRVLAGARWVTTSPDGRSVYAHSEGKDDTAGGVAILTRNTTTGALGQAAGEAGCVSALTANCTFIRGPQFEAGTVAISPDGKSAYIAGQSAIAIFTRDADTGALTQLSGEAGCLHQGQTPQVCTTFARGLDGALGVTVSPDGKSVYVASRTSQAVAAFVRDTDSGGLAQFAGTAGCVSETGGGGECADGKALGTASSVAVSPDGRSVYVGSPGSSAVAVFARSPSSGVLTQLAGTAGCVSDTGTGGQCADGKALNLAVSVAISPDGRSAYAAANSSSAGGLAAFAVEAPPAPKPKPNPTSAPTAPPKATGVLGSASKTINGTPGNDTITGTPGDDVINCGAGNDTVNAGGGDDVVNCGAGNDVIDGGAGDDRIKGEAGKDRVSGGAGKDTADGGAGNDRVSGNEDADRLSGGSGKDRIAGNQGGDRLNGGRGNDSLAGGSGADRLSGGSGKDKLAGGSGNDRLAGGSGKDRLAGGAGRDGLSGGAGRDSEKQ